MEAGVLCGDERFMCKSIGKRVCALIRLRARSLHSVNRQGSRKSQRSEIFGKEEEPPCKSSVLPQGKMLTAQARSDEVRDQEVEKRHPLCRVFVCAAGLKHTASWSVEQARLRITGIPKIAA